MSQPTWLNQVTEIPAASVTGSAGQSETGAVLSAIADAMAAEGSVPMQFSAGEVVGVVIERLATAQHAIIISTGSVDEDVRRVAQQYDTEPAKVSLVPAAQLLAEQYDGIAGCLTLPKPAASTPSGRVTLDELEYQLQKHRADGVPGSTFVVVNGRDNIAKQDVACFEVKPRLNHIGKADFDKKWLMANYVSRGGVPVLVLG